MGATGRGKGRGEGGRREGGGREGGAGACGWPSSQHFRPATCSLRVWLMIAEVANASMLPFLLFIFFLLLLVLLPSLFPTHIAQPFGHWTGHDQGLLTSNGLEGDGHLDLVHKTYHRMELWPGGRASRVVGGGRPSLTLVGSGGCCSAAAAACLPPFTVMAPTTRPPYLEWTGKSWTHIIGTGQNPPPRMAGQAWRGKGE